MDLVLGEGGLNKTLITFPPTPKLNHTTTPPLTLDHAPFSFLSPLKKTHTHTFHTIIVYLLGAVMGAEIIPSSL